LIDIKSDEITLGTRGKVYHLALRANEIPPRPTGK